MYWYMALGARGHPQEPRVTRTDPDRQDASKAKTSHNPIAPDYNKIRRPDRGSGSERHFKIHWKPFEAHNS